MSRKIEVDTCTECPFIRYYGGIKPVSYIPYCELTGLDLPYTVGKGIGRMIVATATGAIPEVCPLYSNDTLKRGQDVITSSNSWTAVDFIRESNRIEGITREPTKAEISEYDKFMGYTTITVQDMQAFVSVYQPKAKLRSKPGMNVTIGAHRPQKGGAAIVTALEGILADAMNGDDPYVIHQRYESLHPFTDGNGRSGRMLWMWQMMSAPLGFLHTFYYQALDAWRGGGI